MTYRFSQGPDQDEKFRKLQMEKDNLQLQVQVLTDQIDAQTDKIADLEKSLTEKKQLLVNAEDMLQRVHLQSSLFHIVKCVLSGNVVQVFVRNPKIRTAASHQRNEVAAGLAGTRKFGTKDQSL